MVSLAPSSYLAVTANDSVSLDALTADALERHHVQTLHDIVVRRFTHHPLFVASTYPLSDLCDSLVTLALERSSSHHLAYFVNSVLAGITPEFPLDEPQVSLLAQRCVSPFASLQSLVFPPESTGLDDIASVLGVRPILFTDAALDFALTHSAPWAVAAALSALSQHQLTTLLSYCAQLPRSLLGEFTSAVSLQLTTPERLDLARAYLGDLRLPALPLALYTDPLPTQALDFVPYLASPALAALLLPNDRPRPRCVSAAVVTSAALSPDLSGQLFYRLRGIGPARYPTWYAARLFLRVPGLAQCEQLPDSIADLSTGYSPSVIHLLVDRLSSLPDYTYDLLTTRDVTLYEALRATQILATD